jgi:adenylate cyclase
MEIERKWLVDRLPEGFESAPGEEIDQGYLAIEEGETEVRLRRRAGLYSVTVKSAGGLVRGEYEAELVETQFVALWPATEGRRVEKTRHLLGADSGETIELDVFRGSLAGLIVAEVEFGDVDAAQRFVAPEWFGREVTEDRAYRNQRLAVDGRP